MEKANKNEDYSKRKHEENITNTLQKLNAAKEKKDRKGEGQACCDLTKSYYRFGLYEKSVEYGKQLVDIADELQNSEWKNVAYDVLGWSYYNKGDYKESVTYGMKELANANLNEELLRNAFRILAWSYYEAEDYEQSTENGNKLLAFAKKANDLEREISAYEVLALSCCKKKDNKDQYHKQSMAYGDQLLTIAKENTEYLETAYNFLADLYHKLNKHVKANEYRKLQKGLSCSKAGAAAKGGSTNCSSESFQAGEHDKQLTGSGLKKPSDSGDFKETKEGKSDEALGILPNGSSESLQAGEHDKQLTESGFKERPGSGDFRETKKGETDEALGRLPNGSSESLQAGEHDKQLTGSGLKERSDSGDFKETKEGETDEALGRLPNGSSVPSGIEARGPEAKVADENALRTGKVRLYRARIILIGQVQAGKTSLKKSLLGLPFESQEESIEGTKVDPTVFEIDVTKVKNWQHSDDARIEAKEVTEIPKEITINEGAAREKRTESVTPALKIDPEEKEEEITKVLVQHLSGVNLQSDVTSVENRETLDLWDFAGQHLYYAFYPVFLLPRAIYLLVHNLSKDLKANAQPCVRQEIHETKPKRVSHETNLENLLSWLASVTTLCYTKTDADENSTKEKLSYVRPPIFIVGTHADNPHQDIKEMEKQIGKAIDDKAFGRHVIRPFFAVDNTQGSSDQRVADLKKKLIEVLKELQPYMGEEVPIGWLKFEKVVQALVAEKVYYLQLQQLQTIIQKVCFLEDNNEVTTMLNFYHDLGIICKHRDTVVLQAQWLIGVFKQLISIRSFNEMEPKHVREWKALQNRGVLSMELVDHLFSKLCPIKEDILHMMEQFGLIVKFATSPTAEMYFVPCQLKIPPKNVLEMESSRSDPSPLYLRFEWNFVPYGFFSQFMSEFTRSCSKRGVNEQFTLSSEFFAGASQFIIKKTSTYELVMRCKKGFITIVLKQVKPDGSESSPEIEEVANTVRKSLENAMQSLTTKLPWLKNVKSDWCAACPFCPGCSQKPCTHEDCPCLLKIPEGRKEWHCKKEHMLKTLAQPRLEKWYSMKATVPSTTKATLSTSTLTITTSERPATAPPSSTSTLQQQATAPTPSTRTLQQPYVTFLKLLRSLFISSNSAYTLF